MENKQDKGFTLVELLIVIVILGILATVTVFAVRGITDQGQTSACNADEKTLQTATEAYFAQFGGAEIANTTDPVAAPASMTAAGFVAGATPEATLQNVDLIVEPSGNFEVTSAGVVQPTSAECGFVAP